MQCGFIGLGMLGARMARQVLEAGHALIVFDLDNSPVEKLVSRGATGASSVTEAASKVDVLITCLPSPDASMKVMTGADGALDAMRDGSCWIEMSTTDVNEMIRLAGLAAEQGIGVLECPATGGVHRAARGEMTLLVGGDEALFRRHASLLKALSGQLVYMGKLGNASLIKVITNLLCLVDLVAMGEALMLAKRGGLDLAKCYEAITASSGSSREFEDWAPVILNGSLNTGFTTDLGLKDLGFVTELGRRLEVPLQLTTLVEQMFKASRDRYGGDAWTAHVVKMMEEAAGETLRAPGFAEVIPEQ
ncbi:MAG TPA: 3-hydroxyisobutyrate dehydrogenase [Gammaproteobacteria bacterium]|jgi:3-hydroxyisobutyrate dehydrogenase|nr:3-hydroxyisobutyrate dehydrogenase [Acidiferrobacteraceae bacterium]MDP6398391.1 NAD(P)-dependent oxidoreductase [Arenicellales bacterium]HCX88155.1 3-hydroxyisobutyrate dehydrogenase [Gammaproteobacteria bacterium]MDP6550686.1 NAD(P)-dependent oxidoreductase [Arenicellales bacterium]MDP6791325.1 NAD(P)-dependent oxidoreductase [Arenicellales bacterium]|tara:strand:+ start:37877 stop:38791 length:915 start_codon:yes stop_codon:yes gene_type:complete